MTDEERQELFDKLVELFDSNDAEDSQLAALMAEASGILANDLFIEWMRRLAEKEDYYPDDLRDN